MSENESREYTHIQALDKGIREMIIEEGKAQREIIRKSLEARIIAKFQGDGGDNRAKSEHVYFVNGMLVLLLNLASQKRK